MKRLVLLSIAALALLWSAPAMPGQTPTPTPVYTRVNLVSDIDGVARFTDPNLVNPWGLGFSSTSPFWVADNGAGVATLYNGQGQAFPTATPLVVTIPSPTTPTGGTPTGLVFTSRTTDFVLPGPITITRATALSIANSPQT